MILVPPKPHVLIDFYGCDPDRLNDAQGLKELLYRLAREIGATIIGDIFHKFSPHGVTGVVAIAESHLSIHTWVEYGYAAVDLFMCNSNLTSARVEGAIALVTGFLRAKGSSVTAVQRGAAPIA